jgi:hypothetical protein
MTNLFFYPFHHILAVLKVVKFIAMTLRNCRPFALSLFSEHADGVIPRALYSPENKYCSGCKLFRMRCNIPVLINPWITEQKRFVLLGNWIHFVPIFLKLFSQHFLINPLTPELNPSAQRCLSNFLQGILKF